MSDDIKKEDTPEISENDISEETQAANEKEILTEIVFEKNDRDKKTKTGLKTVGIISIVLAVAGLALIGLCVYFLMLKPTYDKNGDNGNTVTYDNIASVTDSSYSEKKPLLEMIATSPDATPLDATSQDAPETDTEVSDEE